MTDKTVATYKDLKIKLQKADGEDWFRDSYYAENGHDTAADGAESIEEAKEQIDQYWAESQHGELNGMFKSAADNAADVSAYYNREG